MQLGPVRVGADEQRDTSPNVLSHGTQLERLPEDLQHTPQTVTVIPQVVIQQQQATTIDQVLKYVPGVTVATLRDATGSSRKFILPLLEYLDAQRFTRRQGDARVLVEL